ncbi:tape measure protein [Fructilactobacillus fructivorans]|uniref:aggregation-promoting factor C-terminal-like domain-containing protein n=1 Tax=Fructilactobacillus fructivorans TaxID=1614 RepID=UPI00070FA286|nr:tape measure protein [Fructilactobacillus fructivorans]
MASKDVVNTLASKISLDVDDSDLYSLRNELRRTNAEWKNTEDRAKLAGNQSEKSAAKVGKQKDALIILRKELDQNKTALKNTTGSSKQDVKARQDYEKEIRKLNIQISKHSNYLEKDRKYEQYYKAGIEQSKKALEDDTKVHKFQIDRLNAEGKTVEATKKRYSSMQSTLEKQSSLYQKEKDYLERLKSSRGADSSEIAKQRVKVNELGTSMAKSKTQASELSNAVKKNSQNPFTRWNASLKETNSTGKKTESIFHSIVKANLATSTIRSAWNGITNHIGSALAAGQKFNNQQQQMGATWQTLSGTVKKSHAMVGTINDLSTATGQSVDTVNDLEQGFYHLHSNKGESDDMTKSMLNMADAVGLNGQQINSVTNDMVNGLSRGKANAGMLNQISQYFPMFREQLAKTKNVSVSDLNQMAKQGKISANDIEQVFSNLGNKKYGKAADRMLSTAIGSTRAIKAQVPRLMGDIEKPIQNMKNPLFLAASKWVSDKRTDNEFKKLGSSLSRGFDVITKAFSKVFTTKSISSGLDSMVNGVTKTVDRLSNNIAKNAKPITQFFRSVRSTGTSSFKLFLGTIKDLSAVFLPFLNFMAKHAKVFAPMIAGLTVITKLTKPLMGMKIASQVLGISSAVRKLTASETVMKGVTATLDALSSPWMAIPVAITAIITGLALLYKKVKPFRDFVNKYILKPLSSSFKWVNDQFKRFGHWMDHNSKKPKQKPVKIDTKGINKDLNGIKKDFSGSVNLVKKRAGEMGNNIAKGFKTASKNTRNTMQSLQKSTNGTVEKMRKNTPKQFKNMWNEANNLTKSAMKTQKDQNKLGSDFIHGRWSNLGKDVKNIAKDLWKEVKDVFKSGSTFAKDSTKSLQKSTRDTVNKMRKDTPKQYRNMWNDADNLTKSAMKTQKDQNKLGSDFIHGRWSNLGGDIKRIVRDMWKEVRNIFKGGFDFINDLSGGRLGKLTSQFSSTWHSIGKGWHSFWNGIGDFFKKIWNDIKKYAHSGMKGIIGSLNAGINGIDWVIHAFGGKSKTIKPIKYATGTGVSKRRPINKQTYAMLNDGKNVNGSNKETAILPNENAFQPKEKNWTGLLPAGTEILNAEETNLMEQFTHFASGTGLFKGIHNAVNKASSVASGVGKSVSHFVGNVASSIKQKVSMAKNILKSPGKALTGLLKKPNGNGAIFSNFAKGMYNKMSGAAKSWWSQLWNTVDKVTGSGSASDFLNKAIKDSKGKHYVWGATGSNTFDCSGLITYVAKQFGKSLPHFSGSQYSSLPHVSEKNAQPGDLAYFGHGGSSHVGIVSGKNRMWSAQSPSAHPNIGYSPIHGFGEPLAGFAKIPGLSNKSSDKKNTNQSNQGIKNQVGNGFFNWMKKYLEPVLSGGNTKQPSGSHKDWLGEAGISPSDFGYYNYIINHESNWNPRATNPNGGAYGLPQSLPASKMASAGKDYRTNPITQLKWMKGYVKRYGGAKGAYDFWTRHHAYANGGIAQNHQVAEIAENNKPEMVIPMSAEKRPRGLQLMSEVVSKFAKDDPNLAQDNHSTNNQSANVIQEMNNKFDKLLKLIAVTNGLSEKQIQAIYQTSQSPKERYKMDARNQSISDYGNLLGGAY